MQDYNIPPTPGEIRPLIDGCPECVTTYNRPVSVIRLPDLDSPTSAVAAYHCPDCGHVWQTSWSLR
jgi:uncharacterized Zn finger protein